MELNAVIVAIAVLAGVFAGFFIAVKALQFGMRWSKQTERGGMPTMAVPPNAKKTQEFNPMREIMTGEVSTDEQDE